MYRYKFAESPYSSHVRTVTMVGYNKTVLEIGCGEGHVTKRLAKNGCKVTGIDIDKRAIELASAYCNSIFMVDIEELPEGLLSKKEFDVIIFGDVLEHLRKPLDCLKNVKQYLKDGGFMVCSLPNVAHISVRIMLLFGKWNYTEEGILNNEHLRFFTRETAVKTIEDAGYRVENVDIVPRFPMPLMRMSKLGKMVDYFICNLYPKLFAFQFMIKAYKIDEESH